MRRFIGAIETILGLVVSIGSIIGFFLVKELSKVNLPNEYNLPVEELGTNITVTGVNDIANSILSIIPIIAGIYLLIIFLLGIFIFLEGLSKLDKYNIVKVKGGKKK